MSRHPRTADACGDPYAWRRGEHGVMLVSSIVSLLYLCDVRSEAAALSFPKFEFVSWRRFMARSRCYAVLFDASACAASPPTRSSLTFCYTT